ncbi:MAG: phosphotransferase [Nevskiales bacterium]|nr:phosphotransferase [Nevskiales bacterium]
MTIPAPRATVADSRAEQACAWACARLALSGASGATFGPASTDASFRRYFRLRAGDRSWVVMDAPPERESCGPFIAVARLLRSWNLHAPEILAEDRERGFLLLSDLGTQTYLQALTPDNADALLHEAVEALLTMQRSGLQSPESLAFLPAYDARLLRHEAQLFSEWYLPRHLNVTLSADEHRVLQGVVDRLVESALAQPRCFVHRDYMPRNLMVSVPSSGIGGHEPPASSPLHAQRGEGRAAGGASGGVREEACRDRLASPGILDFQDAVIGPVAYDVVSLFKDAFLSWPEERVQGWARDYWERARRAQIPVDPAFAEFWRQLEWMGVQRHLKVLGIFARLTVRDGKPQYAADTPRFVRYVMAVAPNHPELVPLTKLFERHVLPVVTV